MTTWFLGGRQIAQFIKFHFEVVDTAQLTYTASNTGNNALSWYVNTAYIMQASNDASVCQTFLDTSGTAIESRAIATGTMYIQQVNTLPVVGVAGN